MNHLNRYQGPAGGRTDEHVMRSRSLLKPRSVALIRIVVKDDVTAGKLYKDPSTEIPLNITNV